MRAPSPDGDGSETGTTGGIRTVAGVDRRSFIKAAGVASLGAMALPSLAACGDGGSDASTGSSGSGGSGGGGTRPVKLGFIALTDCASIVMAKELGYFAERDLDVERRSSRPRGRRPATRCSTARSTAPTACSACRSRWPPASAATGSRDLQDRHDAQQQRAGDHARQRAWPPPATATSTPPPRRWPRAGTPDAGHDLPRRHPRHLAALLAARPPARRLGDVKIDPDPAAADGAEHDRRQRERLLRRRAVERGGRRSRASASPHLATQDLWQHHPEKALVVNAEVRRGARPTCSRT